MAALIAAVLGCAAIWRASLGFVHYRLSIAAAEDLSEREIEQVAALFEWGLAGLILAHAVAALYFMRRPLRPSLVWVVSIAAAVGILVAGSLWKAGVLANPGLLPISLILTCGVMGYRADAPWSFCIYWRADRQYRRSRGGNARLDLIVMLFAPAPTVVIAFVGVALGEGCAPDAAPAQRIIIRCTGSIASPFSCGQPERIASAA